MKKVFLGLMAMSMLVTSCKNDESKTDSTDSTGTGATSETTSKKLTKDEIDKAMADYATPGDMQKWLTSMTGTWDADMTMWMYPDSPAMKTKGVAVYKMAPDSLHLESTHTAEMGPMKFVGKNVTAYDNIKKVFVSTWYDNMSSGIMMSEGTYDAATKTYTAKGKGVDPAQGKEVEMREVTRYTDDNTIQMEMFCMKDGKETKTMELTAKRRQK